jgi:hypothetical protein
MAPGSETAGGFCFSREEIFFSLKALQPKLDTAKFNLRKHAKDFGLDPDRLVFANG